MIKDIEISVSQPLYAGERWIVTIQQLPGGSITAVSPNPTTSPFYIRDVDDENCYKVTAKKSCPDGTFGLVETFTIGDCDSDEEIPDNKCYNYQLTNTTNELLLYSYIGCNNSLNINVPLAASGVVVICAKSGTVAAFTGITIIKQGQCGIEPPPPMQRTIEWSFTLGFQRGGGINIKKNGVAVVTKSFTSNGNFTAVDGDVIDVLVSSASFNNTIALAVITIKDSAGSTITNVSNRNISTWSGTVSQNIKIEGRTV